MIAWVASNPHGAATGLSAPDARTTVEPVRSDGGSELPDAPKWNELDIDSSQQLKGLSPRQLSGDVHESQQYVPWHTQLANENHNRIVDDQVSTSGTAAHREESGAWGHGTAEWTESIEPVIREGARFGNDYFLANGKAVQEGAGSYMMPDQTRERYWAAIAQQSAETRARDAAQSSVINDWYGQL